ncbi:HTTM domain-containing protein [Streptomyces sp. NPDC008313]|uniref:HTTM domain-containing protein n=1 Tax=Streptomyces sp. NPDC008313 TaxID=3364826 RepID=UPI0036E639F8
MNRFALSVSRAVTRVTETALGPYQTAVIRIGFSVTWLLFLLREFPHRQELYGPDGPWSWDLAQRLITDNGAFSVLMWSDGRAWFEAVYALAVLSSALLLVGWRTRTMSVLFMVGVLSLQNRSIFMGDGGDNVIHLMAVYLVFTRCGQVWSLDARRAGRDRLDRTARARTTALPAPPVQPGEPALPEQPALPALPEQPAQSPARADRVGPLLWAVLGLVLLVASATGKLGGGLLMELVLWGSWSAHGLWWLAGRSARGAQPRILLDVLGNIVHNAALLVIMAEACLIYSTAGWYKIQGSRWQDGTAVYYPLHLDYFSPWPALSDLLTAHGTLVMLVTYGTVAAQVAFPFTLFNRRVKNVLLAAMITEHAVIAVVLGLPFFSLAMIAADAVFLPTSFLRWAGGRAARARGRLFPGGGNGTVPGPRGKERRTPETAGRAHVGFTA